MEYKIVESFSRSVLEERVNRAIGNGFVPIGGVSTDKQLTDTRYSQAMIKEEKVEVEHLLP